MKAREAPIRIAVISDVHGNRPALEAVLSDIRQVGAELLINLGDHLSGPIDPVGTADLLMSVPAISIRGNHDRWLAERSRDGLDAVDRFVSARLQPQHLNWLSSLPASFVHEDIYFCHGVPDNDEIGWLDAYWHKRSTTLPAESDVAAHGAKVPQRVMLCGHTHIARSVRLRDGRMILNPGSVGLQFVRGSPDARYALLEQRGDQWSASIRMVAYDHERSARAATANGFPHWREALTAGWADPDNLF